MKQGGTSDAYLNKHNLHWYGCEGNNMKIKFDHAKNEKFILFQKLELTFSPLWIRRCFVRVELSEKAFLQERHLKRNLIYHWKNKIIPITLGQ